MSCPTLFVLLLPFFIYHTLATTVTRARITGDCDTMASKRIAELRKRWPKWVMNEQFSSLPDGASVRPNATVFEDISLKGTDVESSTAVTTFLKQQENGSVYWELVANPIREAGWVKHREALSWDWGVNNTISFNEAVRIIANSTAGREQAPDDWMLAFQERTEVKFYPGFPDQLYWRFITLGDDVFLGQRDRIIRTAEPDAARSAEAGVATSKRQLTRAERKEGFADTGAVRREGFPKRTSRIRR